MSNLKHTSLNIIADDHAPDIAVPTLAALAGDHGASHDAGARDNTIPPPGRTRPSPHRAAAASDGTLRLPTPPASLPSSGRGMLRGNRMVTTFRPGPDTVDAIITAAAIIACADGQVSDLERRSLLHFLRQKGILERKGRAAATAAFNQAVALAVTLGLDETCAATEKLRALAERPGAPLVAHAAAMVALADGVGWPQEIALLEIIRDRLGLRSGLPPEPADVLH